MLLDNTILRVYIELHRLEEVESAKFFCRQEPDYYTATSNQIA
jgi:hypothetical protein